MNEALGWIRDNALPLATVEAGRGFADLERMRRIIGEARIVSLGEATHGTREFFQLKHRLLEFCVSELGFTIFGIEASYPECLRVNDYVLHGTGNPAEALAGTRFWTWDTEEVLALIEWMRAWNRTHEPKVKFYGFDMQFPTEAALGVLEYLKRVAPELAAASEEPLWPLSDDISADHFHLFPGEARDAALTCIERILEAFACERPIWVAATGELEWQLARLNAVVLDQSARYRLSLSHPSTGSRDVAMAENVAALLKLDGPEAKAVLWAHNGHAARETRYFTDDKKPIPNMGSRLHTLFDRRQLVVGFAFNQGSFQAIEMGRGLVTHTVAPAPEGSLDQVLAAADTPAFLLDLATAPPAGPVADWLASGPLSRSIGAVYSAAHAQKNYLQAADPRRSYDVLAFVETTSSARSTRTGRRLQSPKRELAPAATNLELAGSGDVPEGWDWSGNRSTHAYRVALFDAGSPRGGRSLYIARASAPWRWGAGRLKQTFSAEAWRGKRLRFGGAMRAEVQGPGTGTQLYVEVWREGVPSTMPAAVGMVGRPVRSPRWGRYAAEIDIPETAHSIVIGLTLAGNGAGWFGDLELESG
ncbi:MAG: erythromycin esterase family protein [Xanthobacteraceae bacterium]